MRPDSSNFFPSPPFRDGCFGGKFDSANGTDGSVGIMFVRAKGCEDKLRTVADGALKFQIGNNPSGPLSGNPP